MTHLSYVVLGAALLGPTALIGALLHIVGHGVTKITLFFCAGAIHARTHRENVSELTGIGRQMPITMAAFALASLSMAGIPPFVLFVSKFYLGWGAAGVDQQLFMVLYIASGVLSAAYLFPIVIRAFWGSSPEFTRYGEADMRMVVPLAITGVLALVLGIVPNMPVLVPRARVRCGRCRVRRRRDSGRRAVSNRLRIAVALVAAFAVSIAADTLLVDHGSIDETDLRAAA